MDYKEGKKSIDGFLQDLTMNDIKSEINDKDNKNIIFSSKDTPREQKETKRISR